MRLFSISFHTYHIQHYCTEQRKRSQLQLFFPSCLDQPVTVWVWRMYKFTFSGQWSNAGCDTYILTWWFLKFGALYCEKSSNREKKKYLTQLAQKPKFWYLTHQSYPVHTTTGLTQNWPSFFHCSLECLKSHHHQVTNLLFNRTSTTYTLGGSRNSFRGLWRWCFWCSKTEKCIFTAVAKKKHSISVLKVKELTPQNQILAMNTLKSFKLNFLTAGVVYSIAQKRQRQPVHCYRKIEKQCKFFSVFNSNI